MKTLHETFEFWDLEDRTKRIRQRGKNNMRLLALGERFQMSLHRNLDPVCQAGCRESAAPRLRSPSDACMNPWSLGLASIQSRIAQIVWSSAFAYLPFPPLTTVKIQDLKKRTKWTNYGYASWWLVRRSLMCWFFLSSISWISTARRSSKSETKSWTSCFCHANSFFPMTPATTIY